MRRCLSEGILISIVACAGFAQSYTISTVFGGPPPDNSVAKVTTLPPMAVQVITADSAGNVYFVYLNTVFKLTASRGTISRVAGTVTAGYSGDNGPALSAQLDNPFGLAVDSSGNLYIADTGNAAVRKVSNGIITTVVGNGTTTLHCADGPATGSVLDSPSAVAVDSSGTLYVTDQNLNCVVKVANGNLTRLAGTDNSGHSGDNGPAINATLRNPQGVAVDSAGNVYVADSGNNMIRKISNGVITDAAGIEAPATGSNAGFSGDTGPATSAMLNFPLYVVIDSNGNLLIADYSNNRIRKVSNGIITTVAGGGTALGDGGPASSAQLSGPVTIGLDAGNNLYIADERNERIREVSNGVITTLAGNGGAYPNLPYSLALDSAGDLYVDDETSEIKKITAATGGVTVVAGGGTQGSPTGPFGTGIQALNANLYQPFSIAVDPLGNLFISVYVLSQILEDSQGLIANLVGDGSVTYSGDGGPATSAGLLGPGAITLDSAGDIYFVDGRPTTSPFHTTGPNSRIRKVSKGVISTVAGNGTAGYNGDGISATTAQLNGPQGLVVDSAGNVIIADTYNNRIRKVSGGTISTIAGNGTAGFGGDGGLATNAKLYAPYSVALDSGGNLYIADTDNNRIRMISASTGLITTIAGSGTAGFSGDYGPATAAQLNEPFAVAVDSSGRVYVADNGNNAVRVLTPAVSTCTYALAVGTSQAEAAGGEETLSVQTTAFCPWTITDLPAWITVYGLSGGSGPGSATLVLAANTGAARSATVTIAGQSVTITQAGATVGPAITLVANAEGEVPTIAPNTWVEIKGSDLAPAGDSRIWQASDFVNNQLPTNLDGVSVTVNGAPAYIYYISPTQINVLTPPGALSGSVQVVVTNGTPSPAFSVAAQAESPSFFVFNGEPYVAATHVNGSLIGPTTLYPGFSTPAAPGETIVIYGNGFGATSTAVTAGAETQSGTLSPLPAITIGGLTAQVQFAGLNVAPGEFQFNVVVPATLAAGDQPIVATYNGQTTQMGTLVTVQ